MKLRLYLAFCIFALSGFVSAQKVGLVLSGGGAKGIAHIGLIQALEDNNIPIDYITGTSIGAVVGGLYSMGYTPAEMLTLIKSEQFKNWQNGTVENRYLDFFRRPDPTPEILSTSVSLHNSSKTTKSLLPNSLLDPIQLNIAFLEISAAATAQCQGDFDKLFIPYRSVAANVKERKPFIFRKGDLGDAIRASMTFPFVFKAIRVNNHLLYDGGIYDNYPLDIMKEDFNPDILIGSIVDNSWQNPDDYDMIGQLKNMIMHPENDSIAQGKGLQMKFNLDEIGLLDFYKADSVYKIGYNKGIACVDSLKKLIQRRSDPFNMELKRAYFKSQAPVLRFTSIQINGVNSDQQEYILRVLNKDHKAYLTIEDLKIGYFKLLTESNKIKEIIPHAEYIESDKSFRLILDVEIVDKVDISIGANLSSSISNQLYLGVNYQILNDYSQTYTAETYMGRFLNAINIVSRFNFNGRHHPQYFQLQFSSQYYNYFQGEKLFYQSELPAYVKQFESFTKIRYGFPLLTNGKLEFSIGGAYMSDSYVLNKFSAARSNESLDRSEYGFGSFTTHFERNNLNARQYPTQGYRRYLIGQMLTGLERFKYADSSGQTVRPEKHFNYIQLSGGYENYHKISPHFIMGNKGEFVFNNKQLMDNYTSSIIQSPAFTPTPHSMTAFNEAYRSNRYFAIGIIPIWNIKESLYLRSECYGYIPFQSISKEGSQVKQINRFSFSKTQYIAETALVYSLPIANISVFMNKYSFPAGNYNFGVNLGFLLFPKRFIE